eukprot:26344_1
MTDYIETRTELPDSPFDESCGTPPLLINDEIILSPFDSSNKFGTIYKFNTKSDEWSKDEFCDYQDEFGNADLMAHAIHISNDKKTLFIFDGFIVRKLVMIDIETMKVIKKIDIRNMFEIGMSPLIMTYNYDNNELIHVIGGQYNKKHITINTNSYMINTIYEFEMDDRGDLDKINLNGGCIVHISDKNIWLSFHAAIPIHSFDLNTKQWTNTNINMPYHAHNFGYILTLDERYVIIFAGYNFDERESLDDILIFDIDKMKFFNAPFKSPKCRVTNAVITNSGNIHLFQKNKHYRFDSKLFIISSDVLIHGYFKELHIDVDVAPMDILEKIVFFLGDIIHYANDC